MPFHSATINAINGVILNVQTTIQDIVNRIGTVLTDLISRIESIITNVISAVIDPIISIFDTIALSIRAVFDNIVSTIENLITGVINLFESLTRSIVDSIASFIERAVSLFNDIFDVIAVNIRNLVSKVSNFFIDLFNEVSTQIKNIANSVQLFFEDIFRTVQDGISFILDQASIVVDAISNAVETFVNEVVNVVGGSLRDLLETISDLPGSIESLATNLIESANENIGVPIGNIPQNLIDTFLKSLSSGAIEQTEDMTDKALELVFGASPVERDPEAVKQTLISLMAQKTPLTTFLRLIVSPFILMQTVQGIASANSEILLQQHALINPYRVMLPEDTVRAMHFGAITPERANLTLRKTGYDLDDAEILLGIGDFVVPAGEATAWWLRDLLTDDQYDATLKRDGWRDQDISVLRQAAFFIPPVQDLITMAVREVFTPDIAEQFGQFEDFPPEFVVRAKMVGVSEQVARDYWAAHWRLPSVQMGFEMLHRGVIDADTLSLLMRASDIMPFWRDKLIDISFSPLTRVDIRRMHRVGVLTKDEVNKSYHDIGYNDENSARLTDFTLKINEGKGGGDDVALGDLTRSNIIRFFKDGVFDRTTANDVLILTGVSSEAAELFLISAELELEADLRAESIDLVIERAKAGLILFSDARNELSALGLETLEKTRALNQLVREQSKKNKLPSRSDLDKMLRANIISDTEYLSTVQLLGFSETWAQRYLDLINGGKRAT